MIATVIRTSTHHDWVAQWTPVWITLVLAAVLVVGIGLVLKRR
jgi:hypothetical protein